MRWRVEPARGRVPDPPRRGCFLGGTGGSPKASSDQSCRKMASIFGRCVRAGVGARVRAGVPRGGGVVACPVRRTDRILRSAVMGGRGNGGIGVGRTSREYEQDGPKACTHRSSPHGRRKTRFYGRADHAWRQASCFRRRRRRRRRRHRSRRTGDGSGAGAYALTDSYSLGGCWLGVCRSRLHLRAVRALPGQLSASVFGTRSRHTLLTVRRRQLPAQRYQSSSSSSSPPSHAWPCRGRDRSSGPSAASA